MSEKYTTLHPKGDTTVDLYPNIKAANIPDGSIGATKIYPNAIGNGQLAPNAVGYNNIQGGAVHTIQILDGAVTSDKLGSGAVTTAKLDTNSVSSDKIIDGAISTAKLNDGAVTGNKLGFHFYKYRIVLRYTDSNSHVIAPTFTLLTINGNIDENMTMNNFIDALIASDAYEFGQLYDATDNTVTTAFFSGVVFAPNRYLNIEHNITNDTNIAASDLSIFSFSKVQLF